MKDESWLLFWSAAQGCAWGVVISYLLYQISVISASISVCFPVLMFKWPPDSPYSHTKNWMKECLLGRWMLEYISILFVIRISHTAILKSPIHFYHQCYLWQELPDVKKRCFFQIWNTICSRLKRRKGKVQ